MYIYVFAKYVALSHPRPRASRRVNAEHRYIIHRRMDAHGDRVSHNSYELCIMHLHYALGVHIVCYVLRITYYVLCITHCHWESTSSVMYCVLRIMRIMHYALGVHIVYYVLRITYYALCITHWESTSYVMYYVLRITYYVLRTGSPHRMLCIMHYVLCIMYDVDRRDGAQPQRARF